MTDDTAVVSRRRGALWARPFLGLGRVVSYLWLVVLFVIWWWFASLQSTNIFIPSLERIVDVLLRDLGNGVIVSHIGTTLANLGLGLAIAAFVGIVGGIALGESTAAREIVDPIIHFVRSIPQVALVPLIIGTLGIGQGPKVLMVAFACVWPIMLNAIDGVRAVDPTVRAMARVHRVPTWLYFRRVVINSALPQIFAGIRVSLGIGITVVVVAELFAADRGLGYYILNSAAVFKIPESWAGALLIGVIGYAITLAFTLVERIALRWYFDSGATE